MAWKQTAIGIGFTLLTIMAACSNTEFTATFVSTTSAPPPVTPSPVGNSLGDTTTRPADGMTMLFVPAGAFDMGSTDAEIKDAIALCREHYSPCNQWYYDREAPLHTVTLDAYWIDQTEITNAQFRRCVQDGACTKPVDCKKGEPTYPILEFSDHPVVCADWSQAQAYCEWAGARMPTEAEWEYASRGSTRSIFPWGDSFQGNRLNYCDQNCDQSHADQRFDDGFARTAPASAFPDGQSWCGALGMGGNVSEWTEDWFGSYSPETSTNPAGPSSGDQKMIKGCSWFYPPAYCRGSLRASAPQTTRFDYLGFRCATPSTD